MASDSTVSPPNLLPRVVAVAGVLLGAFLVMAAYGHFAAVWSRIVDPQNASSLSRLMLLLPGSVLALTGAINIWMCGALWKGSVWRVTAALIGNVVTMLYLTYLFITGVADHPIGLFLALVSSHVVMLGAIRAGLEWPATAR